MSNLEEMERIGMSKQTKLYYVNENHEKKYYQLLASAGVENDIEREALFYIIAGNDELYSHVNSIYDFKCRQLKITTKLGKLNVMCDSAKAMLKLAIQLYNNTTNKQSVFDTFIFLDSTNKLLALNAICLRF